MSAHRRRQSNRRDGMSCLFSFFLSVILCIMAVVAIIRFAVYSQQNFMRVFDNSYYELVLKNVGEEATHYTLPTGIDSSVLEGVFNIEDLRRDVNNYVANSFVGATYKVDTSTSEARLTENVRNFFTSNNIEAVGGTDQAIATYVEDVMDIYQSNIEVPGLTRISGMADKVQVAFFIALFLGALLCVVLIVAIRRLHHYGHRAMRFIAYATGGTALMLTVVPIILFRTKPYLGLNLSPQSFYHFGVSFIEYLLIVFMLAGAIFFLLTILLIGLVHLMRRHALETDLKHHGR